MINRSFIIGAMTVLKSSKSLAWGFARGFSLRTFDFTPIRFRNGVTGFLDKDAEG
jgi:hypothetical protein